MLGRLLGRLFGRLSGCLLGCLLGRLHNFFLVEAPDDVAPCSAARLLHRFTRTPK